MSGVEGAGTLSPAGEREVTGARTRKREFRGHNAARIYNAILEFSAWAAAAAELARAADLSAASPWASFSLYLTAAFSSPPALTRSLFLHKGLSADYHQLIIHLACFPRGGAHSKRTHRNAQGRERERERE